MVTSKRRCRSDNSTGYGNPTLRFWKYVDKDGPIHMIYGQCWMWVGARHKSGYGVLDVFKKQVKSHRYSYEINCGPIPTELMVLHRCDNPSCVNPAHLFIGTGQDNVDDKMRKMRHRYGERQHCAKVTPEIVRWIREVYKWHDSEWGSFGIAKKLGMCQATIMSILKKKTWSHVE